MNKIKLVYVCDIDQDIDDMIACEFLLKRKIPFTIVLDRPSTSKRIDELKSMGAIFTDDIPEGTNVVFCGGAFTKIATYVKDHKLPTLVANGFFAGMNCVGVEDELPKFKGKKYVPSYNPNSDIPSALAVLDSDNIHDIKLVSKNVCHHPRNTVGNDNKTNNMSKHIHYGTFLQKYNLKPTKRLHDLLMVKEGLAHIFGEYLSICKYLPVDIHYKDSGASKFTQWGSQLNHESEIKISVRLNESYV